jgi:molybdopterin-guanine dinucleotide biosynthesis protein A
MVTLALFSGGKSGRMGQDKALMPFLGQPLIQRIFEQLKGIAEEVILSTNHPEAYAFLNIRMVPDIYPDRGALGGLYSVLRLARHSILAAVACDMPFASPSLFSFEKRLLSTTGVDAVVPSTKDGLEPLHAVYRRDTCLPVVEAALMAGELKLSGWLSKIDVRQVLPEEIAHFDPDGLAFQNLNTLEEFRLAEERARSSKPY